MVCHLGGMMHQLASDVLTEAVLVKLSPQHGPLDEL
jgi:hypothetical protein